MMSNKHDWANKGLDNIISDLKDAWGNIQLRSRKFNMIGTHSDVILMNKWIKEKFGGVWTDEDQLKAEANTKPGVYDMSEGTVKYLGFYADEAQNDGWYGAQYTLGGEERYETYYVKDGWVSANSIKDLTKEEFEKAKKEIL